MKYFVFLLIMIVALEAKKPYFELGVGVAGVSYPAYIGADTQKFFGVAFPYITYRSEMFELDNSGVKKELFDIDGLGLQLSASGSFPVNSDSSKLRKGMDDLDLMFELGGMGSYILWDEVPYALQVRLPFRTVLSTNLYSRIDYRGILANPEIKFSRKITEQELFFLTGGVFATFRYHDYFYGVDKAFVTPQRAAYNAKGGYGGWRSKVGFSDKQGAWVYDAYLIHYYLKGAVFEDSPLIEKENSFFVQASVSYIFYTK